MSKICGRVPEAGVDQEQRRFGRRRSFAERSAEERGPVSESLQYFVPGHAATREFVIPVEDLTKRPGGVDHELGSGRRDQIRRPWTRGVWYYAAGVRGQWRAWRGQENRVPRTLHFLRTNSCRPETTMTRTFYRRSREACFRDVKCSVVSIRIGNPEPYPSMALVWSTS